MNVKMHTMKLTLFDLDHTLIPIDSDYEWGVFTTTLGWTDPVEFARRNEDFYAQYKAGTLDIVEYMRFATQAIRVQGKENSRQAHALFMQRVVHQAIKPQAKALVQQHLQAGDEVLIVTATNDFVTRPIAEAFGVTQLLANQLVLDEATGWYSGEIQGTPTFREGKVQRVQHWLAERQLGWDDVETTFYSDSMNDLPLLERVRHPVATNPDPTLRAEAHARGWRILDLF